MPHHARVEAQATLRTISVATLDMYLTRRSKNLATPGSAALAGKARLLHGRIERREPRFAQIRAPPGQPCDMAREDQLERSRAWRAKAAWHAYAAGKLFRVAKGPVDLPRGATT
jgi:hypothetical protein